ncbi:MAG TPA: hypothetical protein V6C91_12690 [Coleofasciculaceae cyanobacterium]
MDTVPNQNIHLSTTQLEEKGVLISTTPIDSPQSEYQTLLVNGGVTILAIIALTYFTRTLIEAIAKLLKVWNQKE